jgi:fimbrial chaperone protein
MKTIERYSRKAAFCAAFLFCLLGWSASALAAIDISPVLIAMSEERNKEVVRITNSGDTAKSFEVNAVAWSQSEKEREIYSETDDLLAVPPLFTVQPGQTQVVRIGLMRRAEEDRELAYRVFFTELAPPELGEGTTSGIKMRLRFGIPAFIAPLSAAAPVVELIKLHTIDGHTFIELRNTGNVHVKVNEVHYLAPSASSKAVSEASFYLHAGTSGFLPLEVSDESAAGRVELVTDTAGVLEYELAGPR